MDQQCSVPRLELDGMHRRRKRGKREQKEDKETASMIIPPKLFGTHIARMAVGRGEEFGVTVVEVGVDLNLLHEVAVAVWTFGC